MWLTAGIDFFNQYWPYAALAASVAVLVLLWSTWKRVRKVEAQVNRLRVDLLQIQQIESRRLFDAMKSASVAVIETKGSDGPSIIPSANSGQRVDFLTD